MTWHYLQLNYELWKNLVSQVNAFLQDKQAIHLAKTTTNWCGQTGFFPMHSKTSLPKTSWETQVKRTLLNTLVRVPLLMVTHFSDLQHLYRQFFTLRDVLSRWDETELKNASSGVNALTSSTTLPSNAYPVGRLIPWWFVSKAKQNKTSHSTLQSFQGSRFKKVAFLQKALRVYMHAGSKNISLCFVWGSNTGNTNSWEASIVF